MNPTKNKKTFIYLEDLLPRADVKGAAKDTAVVFGTVTNFESKLRKEK